MAELYIPNSVSLRNFDNIFQKNDFDFSDRKIKVTFHEDYVAMAPIGLAFYAAIGDLMKLNGYTREGTLNYKIRSIPYLQRMGLFKSLGFKDPVPTKLHDETGRFIPLTKITDSTQLSHFIKTIDPILHTSRDNSRAIKHVFSEVLRNVLEHSDSRFGGNVCATYNKRRGKISIGISDIGIGLRNSLEKNHIIDSDAMAIRQALRPGISGVTKRIGGNSENAGAGLFFTKCIAQSTQNHFLIYSGSAYYKLRYSKKETNLVFNPDPFDDFCSVKENLPFFPGTIVGIDINIKDETTFNNLIENIGKAYQLSVRKYSKDYYKRIKFQ